MIRTQFLDALDTYCQGKLADPYPLYAQLRQETPVQWSEAFNGVHIPADWIEPTSYIRFKIQSSLGAVFQVCISSFRNDCLHDACHVLHITHGALICPLRKKFSLRLRLVVLPPHLDCVK